MVTCFFFSYRHSRCTQNIVIQKSVLQRAQLQLAYHQWINEDLLMQGGGLNISSVTLPTRSSIMTEIRKVNNFVILMTLLHSII